MLRRDDPQMLAVLNALAFGAFAIWSAVDIGVTVRAEAYFGFSVLFWFAAWFAGRNELRPLIAAWIAPIAALVWAQRDWVPMMSSNKSAFAFGSLVLAMLIIPLAYLILGLIVSFALYRETRTLRVIGARRSPAASARATAPRRR